MKYINCLSTALFISPRYDQLGKFSIKNQLLVQIRTLLFFFSFFNELLSVTISDKISFFSLKLPPDPPPPPFSISLTAHQLLVHSLVTWLCYAVFKVYSVQFSTADVIDPWGSPDQLSRTDTVEQKSEIGPRTGNLSLVWVPQEDERNTLLSYGLLTPCAVVVLDCRSNGLH